MSLKDKLTARSISARHVDTAIDNVEKVIAQTVLNASKNTTGAQAMRGNISTLANDLKVLYDLKEEFDEAAKADKGAATRARKITKPKETEVPEVPEVKEADDVSEAEKG